MSIKTNIISSWYSLVIIDYSLVVLSILVVGNTDKGTFTSHSVEFLIFLAIMIAIFSMITFKTGKTLQYIMLNFNWILGLNVELTYNGNESQC